MISDAGSPTEQILAGLQNIEDDLGTLARTANDILPDVDQRLSGSRRQLATGDRAESVEHARDLLKDIASDAEQLVEIIDELVARRPGAPPVPADERLVKRLDGLATRADPPTPSLGL